MYEYLIFDLDGVLVDVPASYKMEVFREVGEELDMSFSQEQVLNLWHGLEGDRQEILRSWGFEDQSEFWDVFDDHDSPRRRIKHTYRYDDVDIVSDIDNPMGVVTHSPDDLAIGSLRKSDLIDEFDSIISCNWDIGFKPDPEPVLKCMKDLGAEPTSTVMIGDSASDIQAAWNAGIHAVHLDRHGYSVEADHNVSSLREITGAFDLLN